MKIRVFRYGFELEKICFSGKKNGSTVSRRGRVTTWSSKSRRRLRRMLLEYGGVGKCFGVTLTLPGVVFDVPGLYEYVGEYGLPIGLASYCLEIHRVCMSEWRAIVNRWSVYLSRLGVTAIYRIELQERGAPHIHAVVWFDDIGLLPGLFCSWLDALRASFVDDCKYGIISLDCVPGAMLHSFHVEYVLDGDFAAYRYMCDHASKHKQAQLGYQGRQWGVVNRRGLRTRWLLDMDLTDGEYDSVLRYIRRLSHCRVSRGNGGRTVWFTSPLTLAKIVDFIRQN